VCEEFPGFRYLKEGDFVNDDIGRGLSDGLVKSGWDEYLSPYHIYDVMISGDYNFHSDDPLPGIKRKIDIGFVSAQERLIQNGEIRIAHKTMFHSILAVLILSSCSHCIGFVPEPHDIGDSKYMNMLDGIRGCRKEEAEFVVLEHIG
ncbi:hypothetical protein EJB05_36122, partial [Eragrostis curvula]